MWKARFANIWEMPKRNESGDKRIKTVSTTSLWLSIYANSVIPMTLSFTTVAESCLWAFVSKYRFSTDIK